MVIALARPVLRMTRPSWGRRADVHEVIALEPLGPEMGRTLVRALLGETAAAIDHLVARAGGVPLHVIALYRALERSGRVRSGAARGALATERLALPADADVVAWAVADELAAMPAGLAEAA